jgi:hypothetical protein
MQVRHDALGVGEGKFLPQLQPVGGCRDTARISEWHVVPLVFVAQSRKKFPRFAGSFWHRRMRRHASMTFVDPNISYRGAAAAAGNSGANHKRTTG